VQPLLRRDPREIAHPKHAGVRLAAVVAGEVDAERHDSHTVGWNAEEARHDRHVVFADRDEAIHVSDLRANQIEGALPIRLDETLEKEILPLQRAAHRSLQRLPQRLRQADEQRVGEIDDVRQRLLVQPLQQLVELLPENALTPFEHRNHQVAEELRIGRERAARERPDDTRGIPPSVHEARRIPEQREVLLKVNADAAKQHTIPADVGFVGGRRRVERQERHLVATGQELDGQCVIARAAPAVHPRGAGSDREDPHMADG
jgi:hypothetical protein